MEFLDTCGPGEDIDGYAPIVLCILFMYLLSEVRTNEGGLPYPSLVDSDPSSGVSGTQSKQQVTFLYCKTA